MVSSTELALRPKFLGFLKTRLRQGARPVDYLCLVIGGIFLMLSSLFFYKLERPLFFMVADLAFLLILFYVVFQEDWQARGMNHWIHALLPVFSFTLFYTQSTAFDNILFSQTFDPLLLQWDQQLFGSHLHLWLASRANSLAVDELMHFFYFSYYFLLLIPSIIMLKRRATVANEMIFGLALMMYICYLIFILFPANGPIADHDQIFERGFLFIPLLNGIYKIESQWGGAFPSTHVCSTLFITLYCMCFFPRSKFIFLGLCVMIIIATIYCSFHYAIDSLAGLFFGIGFYLMNRRFFKRSFNI